MRVESSLLGLRLALSSSQRRGVRLFARPSAADGCGPTTSDEVEYERKYLETTDGNTMSTPMLVRQANFVSAETQAGYHGRRNIRAAARPFVAVRANPLKGTVAGVTQTGSRVVACRGAKSSRCDKDSKKNGQPPALARDLIGFPCIPQPKRMARSPTRSWTGGVRSDKFSNLPSE